MLTRFNGTRRLPIVVRQNGDADLPVLVHVRMEDLREIKDPPGEAKDRTFVWNLTLGGLKG